MVNGLAVYPTHLARLGSSTSNGKKANLLLKTQNISLHDFRPEINTFTLNDIKDDLTKVGALKQCGFSKIQKMLYRVFLNPNKKIQNYLRAFKQKYYTRDTHILGVQVRLGGCMANHHEQKALMTRSEFDSIPGRISHLIRNIKIPVVYLSTDSDYAEKYLREHLPNLTILTSSQYFTRGHSTGHSKLSNIEAALVDLFLLADSDTLLYQVLSNFGIVAVKISRARKVVGMRVTHYRVNLKRPNCTQRF